MIPPSSCLSSILSNDCDCAQAITKKIFVLFSKMQLENSKQNQALHLNVKVKVSIQQLLFVFLKNVLCSLCFGVKWFSLKNIFLDTYIFLEIKTFFGMHIKKSQIFVIFSFNHKEKNKKTNKKNKFIHIPSLTTSLFLFFVDSVDVSAFGGW